MSKYNYTLDIYGKRYRDMQTYITAYDYENLEDAIRDYKEWIEWSTVEGDLVSYDLVNIRLMTYEEDIVEEYFRGENE